MTTENEAPYHAGDDSDEEDVVRRVERCRQAAEKHLADWLEEAETCFGFVAGHQWTDEEKAYLTEQKRLPVVFNRVAPIINAIRGQEVNNRSEATYVPRIAGAVTADELMNAAARYFRDHCDAGDEEADAFNDVLCCGLGWTETRMDYESNPDGDVVIERRDPMHVRYDPSATKRNLTDRRWEQVDDWLTKEEIEARWPDADLTELTESEPEKDSEPHDATNAWKYEKNAKGYDATNKKFRVTHHVEIELETYYRALNPLTNQMEDVGEGHMKILQERLQQLGMPAMQKRKTTRKVFTQCFVVGKIVLDEGKAASQKTFPRKAMTGYRDRNENVFHGLVRYMLDPAKFANKLFSLMHHVINSNAKGGLMVEEGAVSNMRKFESEWAAANSISKFTPGALSGNKIMPKPPAQYPVQMDHLLEFSVSSIRDSVGVPLELLGMAEKDQPGVLEAQRVRSSLTLLSVMFDSLRAYRKQQAALMAEYIREYVTDGRLIRLSGKQGQRYVQLLRDPLAAEYDIIVDEAPTSRDVKERTFAVLMALVPQAVQAGYPIPQELLDYAPIPEGLRESWKAQIAQAGQRQTPSPEQIKVIGAQQLEDAKHSHKLQQISAATSADMARESAQAESERAIDADKAAHKQAEILLQAQVKKHMETHTAGLEAKVHALQTAIETIAHHVQGSGDHRREVAMVEHTHQRGLEMAEHEARLRPAPKPGTKN